MTTAGDLKQLIGLERQKQLLGCAERGCVAELAAALGVDGVLTGNVTRSESWLVTVKVLHAADGSAWSVRSSRESSEGRRTSSTARPCG